MLGSDRVVFVEGTGTVEGELEVEWEEGLWLRDQLVENRCCHEWSLFDGSGW